ncbi:hypothetical protein ABZ131_20465 [Providencia rettgeri]
MQSLKSKNTLEPKSNYQPKLNERCFARLRTALYPTWIKCDILAVSDNGIAVRLYLTFDGKLDKTDCWLGKDSDVANRILNSWEFISISQKPIPVVTFDNKTLCFNSVA